MKKILGILVLFLLCNPVSIAGEMKVWKKNIKLPKDVSQGYNKGWTFSNNYDRNGDIWKSIYAYNHADNYVMAVLELAEEIRKRKKSDSFQ